MRVHRRARVPFRLGVAAAVVALTAAGAGAQRNSAAIPRDPDDKTIVHVLNRIGFGPAPGDLARVKSIGLAKYIDEQLNPSRIPDDEMIARLSERLARFKVPAHVLFMGSEELPRTVTGKVQKFKMTDRVAGLVKG